jgi:microcystin-dependent protein
MADTFTPNFNLTMPEIGASVDTWGNKLNINMSEIDKFLVPQGGIIMWSGSVANIPNNWQLCDGTNGTPDLRGLFVVGAGGAYAVGATGGANTVTLTQAQIPAHNHTGSTGGAGGHTHSASSAPPGTTPTQAARLLLGIMRTLARPTAQAATTTPARPTAR